MSWGRVLLVAILPGIPWTQMQIDRLVGSSRLQHEVLYLQSAEQMKKLAAGFESLAADLWWLRTVQYFGAQRAFATNKRYDLLRSLVDMTTTLDPRLEIAYRYGAIFLSEPWPTGAGRPEEGIEVLERGCRELPLSWRLRQDLGFFHFVFLKDAKRAADILLNTAEIPGAPFWLKSLAGDILARGGARATSRQVWEAMYEQAEEGSAMKWNAKGHLDVLDAFDGADAVQSLVDEYGRRMGRKLHSLDELLTAGLLPRALVDPSGTPYVYDRESGKVAVSKASALWRPGY